MANFLRSAVSDLFGFQSTALEDTAAQGTANAQATQADASAVQADAAAQQSLASANASTAQAGVATAQGAAQEADAAGLDYTIEGVRMQQAGDYAEAASYGNAASIARNSEVLAGAAGDVQEYQTTRAVNQTVGTQRATIAANGFSNSGTALALARSSFQQGYLTNQMTRMQTLTKEGGFLEAAAAADAEQQAAKTAGDVANTTVGAYQQEQQAYRDVAGGYDEQATGYEDQATGYRAQATGYNAEVGGYQAQRDAYAQQAATYGTMSSQATVTATNLSAALTGYLKATDPTSMSQEDQVAAMLLTGKSVGSWTMNSDGTVKYTDPNAMTGGSKIAAPSNLPTVASTGSRLAASAHVIGSTSV